MFVCPMDNHRGAPVAECPGYHRAQRRGIYMQCVFPSCVIACGLRKSCGVGIADFILYCNGHEDEGSHQCDVTRHGNCHSGSARYHNGAKSHQHDATLARYHNGAALQWCGVASARKSLQWHSGAIRHEFTSAQYHNGTAQHGARHKLSTNISHSSFTFLLAHK